MPRRKTDHSGTAVLLLLIVALLFAIWVTGNDPGPEQEEDLPPDVAAALEDARDGKIGEPEAGAPPKELRPGMAWEVTGAGDSSYDGVYEESGTYNGQPAYTNGTNWLWYGPTDDFGYTDTWILGPNAGDVTSNIAYAGGASLPGASWTVENMGTAPAPTVTEYVPPPTPPNLNDTDTKRTGWIPGMLSPTQYPCQVVKPCRFTSGGLHLWWGLREPWAFDGAEEREDARTLLRGWGATVQAAAKRMGYDVDAVHDLPRILRVPGTTNHKDPETAKWSPDPNHRRPVTLLEANPGRRYNPGDFEEYFPEDFDPREPGVGKIALGDLALPEGAEAELAGRFATALQHDRRLADTWARTRTDLRDPSPSGYDMALADRLAVKHRWTAAEVAWAVQHSRSEHEGDKPLHPTKLQRTVAKAMAAAAEAQARAQAREQQVDGGEHNGEEKEPVAEILVALAEAEADLFRDPDGERFATVPVGEHYETYPILERGGGGLRDWLVRRYRELKDKTPHTTAVGQALVALVAAAGIAPVKQVGLRVAEADGAIWLDLGNAAFEAVRVTRDGWTVTADLPDALRFRRPNGLRPLPRPERGAGSLVELRGFVNPAEDPGGFVLLVAWLLAALRPGYPFPVLALVGEQGTGKSTLARILRLLVDPIGEGGVGLTRPPRDDRDLFAIAANTHVIALDNLTSIPPELSDSLSALATGAGLQARRLYSDSDLTATYARRPIIVNGIGSSGSDIAARPDLLDRALCVPLAPVPDSIRAQEADLWPEVRRIAPGVLADLLDAVSLALRRLPGLQLPPLPRMADFAAWVIAAEPALPWEEGTFLRVYAENRNAATGALLESDPIAPHLQRLAEEGWAGTPSELLRTLETMTSEGERKRTSWPGTAARLGRHLTRIAPALRNAGVEVTRDRDSSSERGKRIALRVSESTRTVTGR